MPTSIRRLAYPILAAAIGLSVAAPAAAAGLAALEFRVRARDRAGNRSAWSSVAVRT